MNEKYKRFKELGLCRRCGAPLSNGKTRCEKCHREHLNYQSRNKLRLIANGMCRSCGVRPKLHEKSTCQECLGYNKQKEKIRYFLLRKKVIKEYGGQCTCCGDNNEKYLQLDHINNDGKAHRLELSGCHKGGMYAWAKRNNFPKVLQLLCANCHQAKTGHGGCTIWDHPPCLPQYTKEEIQEIMLIDSKVMAFFESYETLQISLFNDIKKLVYKLEVLNKQGWSDSTQEQELSYEKGLYEVLFSSLDDVPMHINGPFKEIAAWRLHNGK